jgi:hypothetical protein
MNKTEEFIKTLKETIIKLSEKIMDEETPRDVLKIYAETYLKHFKDE